MVLKNLGSIFKCAGQLWPLISVSMAFIAKVAIFRICVHPMGVPYAFLINVHILMHADWLSIRYNIICTNKRVQKNVNEMFWNGMANLIIDSAWFCRFRTLPHNFFYFCFFINYVDRLNLLCAKFYVHKIRDDGGRNKIKITTIYLASLKLSLSVYSKMGFHFVWSTVLKKLYQCK